MLPDSKISKARLSLIPRCVNQGRRGGLPAATGLEAQAPDLIGLMWSGADHPELLRCRKGGEACHGSGVVSQSQFGAEAQQGSRTRDRCCCVPGESDRGTHI
uniref:Uncharacterized protein n=1 Tax=Saimiri boliviensis boliviensis TaxID=39432 RepID=A0A2K6UN32_SAIBB